MTWKCDYCKYRTGPYKPGNEKCAGCENGQNSFALRKFMHPRQKHEWDQHMKLERFIDCVDTKLLSWQRETLHRDLEARLAARGYTRVINARGCGRSNQRLNLDILMCEFYLAMLQEEKEQLTKGVNYGSTKNHKKTETAT